MGVVANPVGRLTQFARCLGHFLHEQEGDEEAADKEEGVHGDRGMEVDLVEDRAEGLLEGEAVVCKCGLKSEITLKPATATLVPPYRCCSSRGGKALRDTRKVKNADLQTVKPPPSRG